MKHSFKHITYIIIILAGYLGYSQEENSGFTQNSSINLTSAASTNIQNHGTSGYFYNPKRAIDGTEYLFDEWENKAVVYTKDNYKYSLKNINLNIKRNLFLTRLSKDSIFTFNMNGIDKIVVNNKVYKNIYSEKGRTICEVLFESDKFSILKSFYLHTVEGSPNPMINRVNDKIIRKNTFYVLKGESLIKFRFTKRKVLTLIDSDRIDAIREYVKLKNLSFRKEKDVKQILNYNTSL